MEWQREDIIYAIGSYVEQMDSELRSLLANGREDFLTAPSRFGEDLSEAVGRLEKLL